MERPFPAYNVDQPYIFVSYAHDDAALVYPEMVRLKNQGFHVWYDEGINPGSSWDDEVAITPFLWRHLSAQQFLALLILHELVTVQ